MIRKSSAWSCVRITNAEPAGASRTTDSGMASSRVSTPRQSSPASRAGCRRQSPARAAVTALRQARGQHGRRRRGRHAAGRHGSWSALAASLPASRSSMRVRSRRTWAAAALADFRSERNLEAFLPGVAGEHPAGMVDGHEFKLTAARSCRTARFPRPAWSRLPRAASTPWQP